MSLLESYNSLLEKLKFPFYSKQEVEFTNDPESSLTAKPAEIESGYVGYDPFSYTTSSQFGQQVVHSVNKNEMIRRWRESSYLPEVDAAVNEIANEAIVYDEISSAIEINLSDIEISDGIKEKITESFENILYMLDFNKRGDELFKQWYVDGQLNIESVYNNDRLQEGISKLVLLTPYNFNTYIDKETGQKKYYYDNQNTTNQYRAAAVDKVFYDEQITHIDSGIMSMDKKFPLSNLNKAMKPINQLNLIEDSLVIYRITRSPEKRAWYIPTGDLNKASSEQYLRSMMTKYRQKRIYNTETGQMDDKNRSISILEDVWFAVGRDGVSPRVENIPGATPNFTSFEDVDYFLNKVYKALGIPLNRRSAEGRLTPSNTIDIEKDELKFFKYILKLRRKFNNLFVDLMKKDLLAKKILSLEDWMTIQEKINFVYANSNEYSEVKHNQIMSMRIETATSAVSLIESGIIDKEFIQKEILMMTEEEIDAIRIATDKANGIEQEEEIANSEFGDSYDVRPKGGSFKSTFKPPTSSTTIEPEEEASTEAGAFSGAKPTEGGAMESIEAREDILVEQKLSTMRNNLLKELSEGDIITNGKMKLQYINGKLEKIC
jgi:hypothetical protein